jgi:hypothetical protein
MNDHHSALKLRKLMALAHRNPSTEEAQAAALAAQRLALRSGLRPEAPYAHPSEAVREVTTPAQDHLPWWARRLAVIVAGNFACEALLRRADGRQSIAFIGVGDTPDAARFSFFELSQAHLAARRSFGRGKEATGALNDFTQGFLRGVESLLREQAASEALVVQAPQSVRDFVTGHKPTASRTVRIRSASDEKAWSKGFVAGQRAGRRPGRLPAKSERAKEDE